MHFLGRRGLSDDDDDWRLLSELLRGRILPEPLLLDFLGDFFTVSTLTLSSEICILLSISNILLEAGCNAVVCRLHLIDLFKVEVDDDRFREDNDICPLLDFVLGRCGDCRLVRLAWILGLSSAILSYDGFQFFETFVRSDRNADSQARWQTTGTVPYFLLVPVLKRLVNN
jgi:hypothetical protein